MPEPAHAVAQAAQLLRSGRAAEAAEVLRAALAQHPGDAQLNGTMAVALSSTGDAAGALAHAKRAVEARPDDASYRVNLGHLQTMTGAAAEALESYERALRQAPGELAARIGLANALLNLNRWGEATEQMRLVHAAAPQDGNNTANYALMVLKLGEPERAAAILRENLARFPLAARPAQALAYTLNYLPGVDPGEVQRAHADAAALMGGPRPRETPGARDPGRLPRVGLLSPDLRRHSVACFVEPLLRHRGAMEVYCYSTARREDEVSERLRGLATEWRQAAGAPDVLLASQIRRDNIDVLIDLAGLTVGQRLSLLAMKPAAVQCTWCGYPATTGLTAVDARIVDSITDPPGAESHSVEGLIRLDPSFLCYGPPEDAPAVSPCPGRPGAVTFGSFNAAAKLNLEVIACWAGIINATPGSSLVLKSFEYREESVRRKIQERFVSKGLDPSRLRIVPPTIGRDEHLAAYAKVDIALDTFPYNGTTTTFEALHMGVPVVTLQGRMHAGRVGTSILTNLGLGDLIARTPDEYAFVARMLAADGPRLAALRGSLRDRLAASPLCDGPAFARRFTDAVRNLWLRLPSPPSPTPR